MYDGLPRPSPVQKTVISTALEAHRTGHSDFQTPSSRIGHARIRGARPPARRREMLQRRQLQIVYNLSAGAKYSSNPVSGTVRHRA